MNNTEHVEDTQKVKNKDGQYKEKEIRERKNPDDDCITTGSRLSTSFYDEHRAPDDVLNLQRIADRIAEDKKAYIINYITGEELGRYIRFEEVDFDAIRKTDSLLKQAYDLYFDLGTSNTPRLRKKLKQMIARLEAKPHLFCPYEREETTNSHVTKWLDQHTSAPEAELLGFTSLDPYEPKRYIPDVEPRISTSDTNVILGKRKRNLEDADDVCVCKSNSESRLVFDEGRRFKRARRN